MLRWRWRGGAAKVAIVGLVILALSPAAARAQEQTSNEDLSNKYQDALAQLKAAQDRKNELAAENEQFKARIADLERQADAHRRASAEYAERTFFLRSHYAAWQTFIARYPQLRARWRVFLEDDLLSPGELPGMIELSPITSAAATPGTYEGKR